MQPYTPFSQKGRKRVNLQSIVITNSIGIILMLLVLYSSNVARKSRDMESWLLTAMLILLGCGCLSEMTSFLVDGHSSFSCKIISWISNMCIYFINPTFAMLWLLFTDYHLHRKIKRLITVYRPHLILLAVCWLVILGNIFGEYLFTISDKNVYSRQPAAYVFFSVSVIFVINSAVEVYRYRRCHSVEIFFPVWIFLSLFFAGIILQGLLYGVSVIWCATAIGLSTLYMSMQNQLAYRDGLTGVYNRQYLDYILHTWNGRSGIMIDIDYFKDINDRFGHSQGDEALRNAAHFMREAAPDDSVLIRFAGDEFILLLMTDQEEDILKVEAQIREAAVSFNKNAGRPYQIRLSMGHAVFHQQTSDSFLEAIDHAMYLNKQQRHASGLLIERRRNRPVLAAEKPAD